MPSASSVGHRDAPVVKRQKLNELASTEKPRSSTASRIFSAYRTVGLVSSTAVPFSSIPLGKTSFQITTSVGQCLQTYDLKRGMNLVFLTRPQTPALITATYAWKDRVFAAWGNSDSHHAQGGLWVFRRGRKVAELELPDDLDEPIGQILIFGSWIVASCKTRLEIFKAGTYAHHTTLYTTASYDGGNEISGGVCTMPTHLNKILVGRRDGQIEICNVNSGKLRYTIQPPDNACGAVTALEATPAVSMVAIAYASGQVIIHNILLDQSLMHLDAGTREAPITTITFRTDGIGAGEDGMKPGVMATAGRSSGDITFWDLNNAGRIRGVLRGAHVLPMNDTASPGGGINKIEFLVGQPVILSSGLDNALKSWIFDDKAASSIPRILHSRCGHAAPVTRLLFLPTDADGADAGGKWLLSAGKDRSLWGWSLRKDGQSTELSQGSIRKKAKKLGILGGLNLRDGPTTTLEDLRAPEITCLAASLNRDGGIGAQNGSNSVWQKGAPRRSKGSDATVSGSTGWESVVTGHKGDRYARTWFWGRKRAGRWAFETGDHRNVSAVTISPCGTFAVVGSEGGGIDMFNLQSGEHRQRFPAKLTPAQARRLQERVKGGGAPDGAGRSVGLGKHTQAVTGLVVDSLNRRLISTSLDGKIKFWNFSTGALEHELDWHPLTMVSSIHYHAANDLIALTCDDLAIRIVDIETRRTIRELWGCKQGINDCCFSNDGRWLIAASGDALLRVWDLPTGHLIDAIRMESPCTALAFSNTGEFLATSRQGKLGIDLWNNKALFAHIPTRQISDQEATLIAGPTTSGEGGSSALASAFAETTAEETSETEDLPPLASVDQIIQDLMTLSLVPRSRWQTLLHLDLIKARNKPKEAPKQPEKAPFFLPSIEKPGLDLAPKTAETNDAAMEATERSRIMRMQGGEEERAFTYLLHKGGETGDYTPFITHLSTLPPSAADLEIRSLSHGSDTILHAIDMGEHSRQEPAQPNEHILFLNALTSRLRQKRDYELVQAWMSVWLRLHGDLVVETSDGDDGVTSDGDGDGELLHSTDVTALVSPSTNLRRALAEWQTCQRLEGKRLTDLVGWCSGVGAFLRGV